MKQTSKDRLRLINRYLYRYLLRLFMPTASKELIHLLEDLGESEESFSRKIDQAYESLQDTSHLIERLESELTTKIERVSKLKEEYERYTELTELEEKKAKALLAQLDLTINKGKGKDRWIALLVNIVAGLIVFVIGVALSPWIKELLPF